MCRCYIYSKVITCTVALSIRHFCDIIKSEHIEFLNLKNNILLNSLHLDFFFKFLSESIINIYITNCSF